MPFDRSSASAIASKDEPIPAEKVRSYLRGPKRLLRQLPEGYVIPLAGGMAGAVAGIVTCPLDVIKTKLQAQGGFLPTENGVKLRTTASQYHGVIGTAATIVKEDGLRGMYRGLGPMMLGYVPTWAVYLTIYNHSQAYFRTKTGKLQTLVIDMSVSPDWLH